MPKRSSILPKDANRFAKIVTGLVTGNPIVEDMSPISEKNPAAVLLGRLGGLKGGKARAARLSGKRRSEIAQEAAKARWGKSKSNK